MRDGGAEEDLVHAVVSQWLWHTGGCGSEHEMEKVLFAADELTGLIWAAKMRPSKSNCQGHEL